TEASSVFLAISSCSFIIFCCICWACFIKLPIPPLTMISLNRCGTKNIDHGLFQFVLLALYLLQSTGLLLGGGPSLRCAVAFCCSNITWFESNVERSSE